MGNLMLTGGKDTAFSFEKLWNDIVTFFTTRYWEIIAFFLVLIAGIVIIKSVMAILKRIFTRGKMEKSRSLSFLKYCASSYTSF